LEKTATQTAQSRNQLVAASAACLGWGGRPGSLQNQAIGPLLDPREMDCGSLDIISINFLTAPYAPICGIVSEKSEHFQDTNCWWLKPNLLKMKSRGRGPLSIESLAFILIH